MFSWQNGLILIFALFNLVVFLQGFYQTKYKKNAFSLTRSLVFLGIFVWGDAVIFGPFWFSVSVTSLLLKDWDLFLLSISIFWAVRSAGETIYWINQQFSTIKSNPPQTLFGYHIFHNSSIWFIYQIIWQCITVVSIIFSIYFTHQWLKT